MSALRLSLWFTTLFCFASFFAYITEFEQDLALTIYQPDNAFAWFLREWSNIPIILLSLTLIVFLCLPIRHKVPELRYHATLWVIVTLFATGIFNQLILKDTIERPRPRDALLVEHKEKLATPESTHVTLSNTASFTGKSMPSGHAGLAFLLFVPAFSLWQKYRKTALFFLISGSAYGALVGWARMTLGAHFLSDILIAAAINILAAGLLAHYLKPHFKIHAAYPIGLILLASMIIIITKDARITLAWQGELTQQPAFNLPCSVTLPQSMTYPAKATLQVKLKGKGIPETWIYLKEKNNTFSIQRFGIHHQLTCSAILNID